MAQIKELTQEHRVNTISNWLSLSRIVIAPIVAVLLSMNGTEIAVFALLAIMAVTDFLDGFLARKLNQATSLGKILDPLADKIAIAVIAIALTVAYQLQRDALFMGLLILIFVRDFAILFFGLYLIKKKNLIPGPNIFGKISTAALMLMFVWMLLARLLSLHHEGGRDIVTTVFMLVAYAGLALSSVSYLINFIRSVARSAKVNKTPKNFERR